jgi:hypothetical protein
MANKRFPDDYPEKQQVNPADKFFITEYLANKPRWVRANKLPLFFSRHTLLSDWVPGETIPGGYRFDLTGVDTRIISHVEENVDMAIVPLIPVVFRHNFRCGKSGTQVDGELFEHGWQSDLFGELESAAACEVYRT